MKTHAPFAIILVPTLAAAAHAQGYAEPGVNEFYTSWGASQGEQYGYVSETIDDLNGDGVPEVLNSAPFRAIDGMPTAGAAFVHDGRTGAILATHTGNTARGFLGWRLGKLGDIDGDGIGDYGVGAAGNIFATNPTIAGQAFVYSGADHSLIRELRAADYATTDPELGNDRFGQDISALSFTSPPPLAGSSTIESVLSICRTLNPSMSASLAVRGP